MSLMDYAQIAALSLVITGGVVCAAALIVRLFEIGMD